MAGWESKPGLSYSMPMVLTTLMCSHMKWMLRVAEWHVESGLRMLVGKACLLQGAPADLPTSRAPRPPEEKPGLLVKGRLQTGTVRPLWCREVLEPRS